MVQNASILRGLPIKIVCKLVCVTTAAHEICISLCRLKFTTHQSFCQQPGPALALSETDTVKAQMCWNLTCHVSPPSGDCGMCPRRGQNFDYRLIVIFSYEVCTFLLKMVALLLSDVKNRAPLLLHRQQCSFLPLWTWWNHTLFSTFSIVFCVKVGIPTILKHSCTAIFQPRPEGMWLTMRCHNRGMWWISPPFWLTYETFDSSAPPKHQVLCCAWFWGSSPHNRVL